jgi:SdrD B-like domain/FG-GAP-like repeat
MSILGFKRLAIGAVACAVGFAMGEVAASPALSGSLMLTGIMHGTSRFVSAANPRDSSYAGFFDVVFHAGFEEIWWNAPKIWSLSLSSQDPIVDTEAPEYSNNRGGILEAVATSSQPEGPIDGLTIKIRLDANTTTPDFELVIATDQLGIPLQPGNVPNPAATPTAGEATFQLTYGAATCSGDQRAFTIEKITTIAPPTSTVLYLAELVLRFNCGDSLHGVLSYNHTGLTLAEVGVIRGRIWDDEEADGIQAGDGNNSPDGLLRNIQVRLLKDGQIVDSDLTDVGFRFEVLADDYQIEVVPPPRRDVTLRDVGSNEDRDSDLDPTTGRSDLISAANGTFPYLTVGLAGPAPTVLPVASTALQPLLPGTRVAYDSQEGDVNKAATDQVLPGQVKLDLGIGRRILDSARNRFLLSNDARGLRLHHASLYSPRTGKSKPVSFKPPLVLLPPMVNVGNHVSRGRATTTLASGAAVTVNYRYASSFSANGTKLSRYGNYEVLSSANSLTFSGPLAGTNFDSLTTSYDTYALNAGVIQSSTPEAELSTHVSRIRNGLGNDADGNRHSDLVWTDPAANVDGQQIFFHRVGAPEQNAESSGGTLVGEQAAVLRGDFDGDGRMDVAVRDSATSLVSFLNSSRSPADRYPLPVSFSPLSAQALGAVDFFSDQASEILWLDPDTGALSIWKVADKSIPQQVPLTQTLGAPLTLPAGTRVAAIGDFDADGVSDLVVRNDGAGTTEIWFMNGTQRRSVKAITPLSAVWTLVAANDFDGNGRSDLLWMSSNGVPQIWLMDGAKIVLAKKFVAQPLTSKIVDTGDYNADGAADILWQDTQTKTLSAWLMLGITRLSTTTMSLSNPNAELVLLP